MKPLRSATVVLISALLAAGASSGSQEPLGTPWGGCLPGAEPEGACAVVVVDERTDRAVAGAQVLRYAEDTRPATIRAPLLGEAVTDEHGVAWLRPTGPRRVCHWVFDAPGYAVTEEYGTTPPDVVRLEPGETIRGRILGPFGRPRAGLPVELFLGCGHSPAVRHAVTDRDGVFRFTDVGDGRIWVAGRDLAGDYLDLPTPGGPRPTDLVLVPGTTISGVLLDHEGAPVAWATLRSDDLYRGPAAHTDENGRFRLEGLPETAEVLVVPSHSWPWDPLRLPAGVRLDRDRDVRIVLPPPEDERDLIRSLSEGAEPRQVRVVDEETGEAVDGITVRLLRPADGIVFVETSYEGVARVEAPDGEYLLSAGEPFESHGATGRKLVLRRGEEDPILLPVRRRPTLEIRAENLPVEETERRDFAAEVHVAGAAHLIDIPPKEECFLPAKGEAALVVVGECIVRVFPVGPEREGRRTVKVVWPEPVRVGLRLPEGFEESWSILETAEGHHVPCRVGKGSTLLTQAGGRARVRTGFRGLETQSRSEVFDLPEEPGGQVVVRVPPPPAEESQQVRILLPDGSPASATVDIDAKTCSVHTWTKDGLVEGRGETGARVTALREGFLPLRRSLAGEGPWEIRWPAGEVEVRATDAGGEAVPFAALLHGSIEGSESGTLELRGVPCGPTTLVVGTPTHGGRVLEIEVPEEGRAVVPLVRSPVR